MVGEAFSIRPQYPQIAGLEVPLSFKVTLKEAAKGDTGFHHCDMSLWILDEQMVLLNCSQRKSQDVPQPCRCLPGMQ